MRKLKRVRFEDFDVEALLEAVREGRLYVEAKDSIVSKDQVILEVRAYVARIRNLVSKKYDTMVDGLWEQILSNDEFVTLLTPCTKARKCRQFDKYSVMRIIGVLREKGVYEYYNDSEYNAILEQTDKDTPYRKYLGKGIEQRHLLMKLCKIVDDFQL